MTLTYQRFTAVLLLIYGNLFLRGIYYCLRVFWCAAARMSEFELEQRTNIKYVLEDTLRMVPSAETCSNLMLVMNFTLLCASIAGPSGRAF